VSLILLIKHKFGKKKKVSACMSVSLFSKGFNIESIFKVSSPLQNFIPIR